MPENQFPDANLNTTVEELYQSINSINVGNSTQIDYSAEIEKVFSDRDNESLDLSGMFPQLEKSQTGREYLEEVLNMTSEDKIPSLIKTDRRPPATKAELDKALAEGRNNMAPHPAFGGEFLPASARAKPNTMSGGESKTASPRFSPNDSLSTTFSVASPVPSHRREFF